MSLPAHRSRAQCLLLAAVARSRIVHHDPARDSGDGEGTSGETGPAREDRP